MNCRNRNSLPDARSGPVRKPYGTQNGLEANRVGGRAADSLPLRMGSQIIFSRGGKFNGSEKSGRRAPGFAPRSVKPNSRRRIGVAPVSNFEFQVWNERIAYFHPTHSKTAAVQDAGARFDGPSLFGRCGILKTL